MFGNSLLICCAFFAVSCSAHEPFKVKFEWKYINYTWPSNDVYSAAKNDGSYIEANNIMSSVKVWKDKLYLAIPRYKEGVPVTLAVISANAENNNTAPLLEPYPNWGMQKIDDCSALQNVQNMEIDPKGRMWVLDTGRVATMKIGTPNKCPPKLVILDLENNGRLLKNYTFPEDVTKYESVNLKDLVLDHEHGGVAYITDSDQEYPGLIVFSLANSTSWKVHHPSMHYVPDAVGFRIQNVNFAGKVNIDGIAMTPASTESGNRVVYFTPLSSFNMFKVPTQALIDAQYKEGEEREKEIGNHISTLGRIPSQTAGMVMSNTGKLYFGMLADDALDMWDSKADGSLVTGQKIISRDHSIMQWPNGLSFDDKGHLWVISNRMQIYINGTLNVDKSNYHLIMSETNSRNYQYREDGTAPDWPEIADAEPTSQP